MKVTPKIGGFGYHPPINRITSTDHLAIIAYQLDNIVIFAFRHVQVLI